MTRFLRTLISCFGALLLITFLGCGGNSTPAPGGTGTGGGGNGGGGGTSSSLSVTLTGSGTVTSAPAGINCGATCTASFPAGSKVSLSAAPASGFTFTGWSGACSGTGTCTVTMSGNQSVTATFAQGGTSAGPQNQLQVSVTGSGTVTSNPAGINCPSTCSSSFNTGTAVTLTAAPASGNSFTGWGGACSGTGTCTVTLTGNQQVTASFASAQSGPAQVSVTVSGTGAVVSSPAGINCPSTCSASFPAGTNVALTAQAPEDGTWVFNGWSGACTGNSSCTFAANGAMSVTATFTQQPLLQVSVTGSGSVASSPAGISCGATCSAPFATASTVTLTATPAAGFALSSWGGACSGSGSCTVTMNGNQLVSATFTAVQPQLHVTLAGTGSGSVTSNPAGINCGTTCTAPFANGTVVTLTATPASGSTFPGWGGACSGSGTCTVTMNGDTSVTATFTSGAGSIAAVNHIIFMANENRGFDHYFGHLNDYRVAHGYGADVNGTPSAASNPCHGATGSTTANCGWDSSTTIASNASGTSSTIVPFHLKTMCVENPSPSWTESHVDWNLNYLSTTPALNGFVTEAAGDAMNNGFNDVYGRRAIGYYTDTDLPYYYFMATQFATSDSWFSPVMSRTHPNRMYLIGATSQGHAYPIPQGGTQLTAPTIFGKLQAAGVSWKIYADGYSYYQQFAESNKLLSGHLFTYTDFLNDVQNGTLPQVAMIDPSQHGLDEHPGTDPANPGPNIQAGAHFVSTLINSLMQSSSWKDSVFIYTYDEAGGFYDHVPPFSEPNPDGISPQDLPANDICTSGKYNSANCNFNTSGFRVPMFIASPFAKPHYVSHTDMDYTAILRFIETRFGLSPLTARDAAQPDMTEFFDFVNVPWATPPAPPNQPVGGSCYYTQFP